MISSAVVTVGTTATVLTVGGDSDMDVHRSIAIRNKSDATIYLGGSDVSTTNGWQVLAGADIAFDLTAGDVLYARVASGTKDVIVLQTGV